MTSRKRNVVVSVKGKMEEVTGAVFILFFLNKPSITVVFKLLLCSVLSRIQLCNPMKPVLRLPSPSLVTSVVSTCRPQKGGSPLGSTVSRILKQEHWKICHFSF